MVALLGVSTHCRLTLSLALVISRAMRSVVAESAVVKAEVVAAPPLPSSWPVAAIVVGDSTLHRNTVRVGGRVKRVTGGLNPGLNRETGRIINIAVRRLCSVRCIFSHGEHRIASNNRFDRMLRLPLVRSALRVATNSTRHVKPATRTRESRRRPHVVTRHKWPPSPAHHV